MSKVIYKCSKCGSKKVQIIAWVNPNKNNEYVEDVPEKEGWCQDCARPIKILCTSTCNNRGEVLSKIAEHIKKNGGKWDLTDDNGMAELGIEIGDVFCHVRELGLDEEGRPCALIPLHYGSSEEAEKILKSM